MSSLYREHPPIDCTMTRFMVAALLWLWVFPRSADGFLHPSDHHHPPPHAPTLPKDEGDSTPEASLDKFLLDIAHKLKLEVFDIDDGVYGYDTNDARYGLRVVKSEITMPSGDDALGLELTEMARGQDERGLVLISGVSGNAALAEPRLQIGDTITGVFTNNGFRERVTALNYDSMVEVIGRAKAASNDGKLTFEVDRLVKRAPVEIEVNDGESVQTIRALSGENLRTALMRKGVRVYDPKTKRFDMPFSTGDCAGEGICGTCLVAIQEGADALSPADNLERLITEGRPRNWRAACRTVVGPDNQGGKVRLSVHPQSNHDDEIDPGVRPLLP